MSADIATATSLLAKLHAETQREEQRLEQMRTKGADHFDHVLRTGLAQMGDHDLDSFTREAGALACMKEGRRI